MKYILLILISMSLLHCERSKESLAGSYKLDKTPEEKILEKTTFSLYPKISQNYDELQFDVQTYVYGDNSQKRLMNGSFTLKRLTKNEKLSLQIQLVDTEKGNSLTFDLPIVPDSYKPTPIEFTYEGIIFEGVFSCTLEKCSALKFAMDTRRPTDKFRGNFNGVGRFWFLSLKEESFKFTNQCIISDSSKSEVLTKDPYYLLRLDLDSEELKCAAI